MTQALSKRKPEPKNKAKKKAVNLLPTVNDEVLNSSFASSLSEYSSAFNPLFNKIPELEKLFASHLENLKTLHRDLHGLLKKDVTQNCS
jgi:glutathionyl-hydroquinone reductase